MTIRITCSCSEWVSVADSPVDPHGTRPSTPPWIWNSTSSRSARSSTSPSRKGVTKAVSAPLNIGSPPGSRNDRREFAVAYFDLAAEHFDRLARHHHVVGAFAALTPFDFQLSAAQLQRRAPF